MTEQERTDLQAEFCAKTIQDMSHQDVISFAYNVLMDSYTKNYSNEEFTEEVARYFPELLTPTTNEK